MMKGASVFAISMAKSKANGIFLLLLLCVGPLHARTTTPVNHGLGGTAGAGGACAFCSLLPPLLDSVSSARRGGWQTTAAVMVEQPRQFGVTASEAAFSLSRTILFMAAPGMSEELRKQMREEEIRSKMSKLKSEGRMKKKKVDGAEQSEVESQMLEAEAFFNRKSPARKFEQRLAERKRVAQEEEAEAEEERRKSEDDE